MFLERNMIRAVFRFRRFTTSARRYSQLPITVAGWPKTKSWTKAALGVGLFAGGLVLGQAYNQQHSSTADAADRSTSPLDTLLPPVYATDKEFAAAIEQITNILGPENVSYDKEVIKAHSDSFFSTHHPPNPEVHRPHIILYPSTTQQVSEILKVAHKYRVPVVANSGLTSLEGQNMHTRGPNSISIAFAHLNNVIEFHPEDLDAVVQPGLGWQELDEYLRSREDGEHLMFGPDPGMGASLGGMTSTSASGTNSQTMRENIVNLTIVLADGTIIKTKQRPRKSSAGYDITKLFIGAEGTLGIITELTVKLQPRPRKELVSVATFPTIKDAAATAQYIISKSGVKPNAVEILDHTTVSFVNESGSSKKKFLEKPTLLFKVGGNSDTIINEQISIIEQAAKQNNLIKFEKSRNEEENAILWAARRNGLWSTFDYGSKILEDKNDVQVWTTDIAVPISALSQVISETNDDLNNLGFRGKFSVMGHIGDGNCHFLILYNTKDYGKVQTVVDRMVYRALKYDGTCTGEHGVGVGKRKYLDTELGVSSVDMMRQLKLLLDPRRILNPDKIFKIDPEDQLDELLDAGNLIEPARGCCH